MGLFGDLTQMQIGQNFHTSTIPVADLANQTIVITGANTGLGFEAAKHMSVTGLLPYFASIADRIMCSWSLNASHLILACRNIEKGEQARKKIVTSNETSRRGKVEVCELDMSSYDSVIAFGDRMRSLSRLDAFIANAGIDVNHWESFEENESTLTVNVISTLFVAMLALPKLRETSESQRKPSHLTFTGSVVHIFAKEKYISQPQPGYIFKKLNDESTADMADRYNLSKLLLLLCVRQLASKIDREERRSASVIVNFVNPGWCKTDLFRTNDGGIGGRVGLHLIGRTAEEGSRTIVYGIVANKDTHGKYLSECRIKPESTFVRSKASGEVEKRVWSELVEILEKIKPGVTNL